MSMVICEDCDRLFDSDDDPDCFIEVGNMRRLHKTKILCESCREDWLEELEQEAYWDRVDEGRQRAKDGER